MSLLEKLWEKISDRVFNNIKVYFLKVHVAEIIRFFAPKIDIIVKKYARHLPNFVVNSEIDDLRTIAQLEFLETIKVWRPDMNNNIWPLAQQRITGAMKDHIRYVTKSDPSRLYDWVADAAHLYKVVNDRADFVKEFEAGDELGRAMVVLTERERKVVLAHTHADQTFKVIGMKIGVSESQVSRIYKKSLEKLKKVLSKE